MDDHASSSGIFTSGNDSFKVDIVTGPRNKGFITHVYLKQSHNGKEVSSKHESFETKDATEARNLHKLTELSAQNLGEGYLSGFNHFQEVTTIENPLEITVDKKPRPEPKTKDRVETTTSDNNRPENIVKTTPDEPESLHLGAGDIGLGVGKALVGTAVGIGIGIVAGPIVAAGLVGGLIFANFMNRYGEAVQQGNGQGAAGRALTAGISDILPISPIEIGEAIYGFDYVTGRTLDNSERNQMLGSSFGGYGAGAAASGLAKARLPRKAMRDAIDKTVSNIKSRENYYVRQREGRVHVGLGIVEANIDPNVAGMFGGGNILLRPLKNKGLRTAVKKTGLDPREIVYKSDAPPILSFRALKDANTGLDANHLLQGEWFKNGPEHLKPLYQFVPSTPLAKGTEHQGTWHNGWTDKAGQHHPGVNQWLESKGLFQKGQYSQKDIEKGMRLTEKWYRMQGSEPWQSYADAIKTFRTEVFDKVKK